MLNDVKKYVVDTVEEVKYECIPSNGAATLWPFLQQVFHIPFLPWLYQPGWLVNYFTRPWDADFYNDLSSDFFSGFTVAITLIPQALSYASLATLPPIVGLYSVILPIPMYIFLGTSMQLGVGPVALISLLTGELLGKYGIDATENPNQAIDFAAQACFASGLLMVIMGAFNLGNLIRFISHPVMSGFTTAAAMIIGLNQMRNAFGFPNIVPRVGAEHGVHYNYEVMEWYLKNWNGRDENGYRYLNVHAASITVGLYVPLAALFFWKRWFKPTAEFKKTKLFALYNFMIVVSTLLAMVIAAKVAYDIRSTNQTHHAQHLNIVGDVPAGLDIFRAPNFKESFSTFFFDLLPLTIISYMESFSVARKIAAQKGTLSTLNPSQELVALGLGNMVNMFATGYPVSGSFSRSALYASSGAVSLLASFTTFCIIILALGTLTSAFYFIPNAALAAVVMVAMLNLIEPIEFWNAWKLSKRDFLVMSVSFIMTLLFDTEIGLGCGLGLSLIVLLQDLAFSLESKPISRALNFQGIEIIRLNSNLVFISSSRIKDTLIHEIFEKRSEELQAVVIDFIDVKHADMSGLFAMKDVMDYARKLNILVFFVNVLPDIQVLLTKSDMEADDISKVASPLKDNIMEASAMVGSASNVGLDVESLGMVRQLLNVSQNTNSYIGLEQETQQQSIESAESVSTNRDAAAGGLLINGDDDEDEEGGGGKSSGGGITVGAAGAGGDNSTGGSGSRKGSSSLTSAQFWNVDKDGGSTGVAAGSDHGDHDSYNIVGVDIDPEGGGPGAIELTSRDGASVSSSHNSKYKGSVVKRVSSSGSFRNDSKKD